MLHRLSSTSFAHNAHVRPDLCWSDCCRPAKWIIISTQDLSAANICSFAHNDSPEITCIVCDPRGAPLSPSCTALVAADEAELTALLAAHDADFTLCVVPHDGASQACCGHDLLNSSKHWLAAHTVHNLHLASMRCRLGWTVCRV